MGNECGSMRIIIAGLDRGVNKNGRK